MFGRWPDAAQNERRLYLIFYFGSRSLREGEIEDNDGPKLVPVIVSRESLRGLPISRAEVTLAGGDLYYSGFLSEKETEESRIVYRKQEGQEAEAIAAFPLSD